MQKLTAKEEEILELMWQLGECAPKDIVALYEKQKPHVNTIATMVQALERKKYVTHRPQGRGYIYFPIVRQKDYGHLKLNAIVNRYFKQSYMNLISTLINDGKVKKEELFNFLNN